MYIVLTVSSAPSVAEATPSVTRHRARWLSTSLGDGKASYCEIGPEKGIANGQELHTVVFSHGWALGPHAYRHSLEAVSQLGCRVLAPSLPGFAGTSELPPEELSFAGYSSWLARFLQSCEISKPVTLVGHSFGGAVAIKFAQEHPGLVDSLVLANPVAAPTWSYRHGNGRSMDERPLWDWGRHLGGDLLSPDQVVRVLPPVLGDLVPNLIQNPLALWRVASLIRQADLRSELLQLARRDLPVTAIWSDRDKLISRAAFETTCKALATEGVVVEGSHAWLIANPAQFAEIVAVSISNACVGP